ncbi:hypothetical protein GALMADRAFT_872377 [Galerina marginata CBS 339.88]|uniref:DUF6535 domain-containing protein n=1 Tax=Galerina marginata (strain CBS 339.88) TaxID=685588 RepID=A0A067TJ05_GALM3|nr:hypothetical protein GALMADRAFT_872377 [Galerina marginata CBS 339.88]
MSSSTAKGMSEEAFQKEQRPDDEDQPEVPEIWGFDDPFIYAPPKPTSDPWSILLEPLMKKDKMQCEAWKEEVQNLLIFAGLFSAVVTAFIIESYRTLQPDPNDTIISLLSIIANRLDNTTIPAPILLSSTGLGSSFSPTTSSIRINNFWFISLVLSLATVLVGIISLQWIREHQNYTNLPPRESFALFNMRADGLKRWHVPKVFTALPLLLQSALVLFLGGVIDFLLSFGDAAVIIPVSVVTVLVLLFLVATTILPTVQSLFLCLPYPYIRNTKVPPAQCPYKSPQAHAFRAILRYIILLWRKVFLGERFPSSNRFTLHSGPVDLATYIWITWTKTTWNAFDMIWLRLRDQFMQHSYHRLTERHPKDIEVELPVFDLFEAIRSSVTFRTVDVNVQDSILAQYHCFTEVSKWIVDPNTCSQPETTLWAIVQSNKYLGDVMKKSGSPVPGGLPTVDARDATTSRVRRVSTLLHEENMFFFLYKRRRLIDEKLQKHLLELAMRLSTVIYTRKYNHYTTTTLSNFFLVPSRIGHSLNYDRNSLLAMGQSFFDIFPKRRPS